MKNPASTDEVTDMALPSARLACMRLLAVLTIALGGCVELAARSDDPLLPGGMIDRLVVEDFATALANTHEPLTTTFQISRNARDPVTTRLAERLVELGFGIQRVPQDQGARFIEHQRDILLPRNGGTRVDDRLTIGRFEARRSFILTPDGRIGSSTPLQSGSVDHLSEATPVSSTSVATTPLISPPPAETLNRVLSWPAPDRLEAPRPRMQVVTREIIEKVTTAAVNNRFYGGDSAFAGALDGFEQIERRTVVFANDSLQLGKTNKRMLARWLQEHFRQNDRLSLIGCSTGYTSLAIGNEGLALGRADRVIDELLSQGVERQAIFNEGCWAPVSAGDTFPGRGVVLELWRRAS